MIPIFNSQNKTKHGSTNFQIFERYFVAVVGNEFEAVKSRIGTGWSWKKEKINLKL